MNEANNLVARVEKFERTVATCLCTIPFLFSAQCLCAALSSRVFAAMFADFGSKLPAATEFVLGMQLPLVLVSIATPIATIVIARKGQPAFSVVFSTIAGVFSFFLAISVTFALFLPIFQLAEVAGGGK